MARNFGRGGNFARPENALKRSEELENVGQKNAALQALHDVLCSKKHRQWSSTYEQIMKRHIDLCVDMKKRNMAKEALMQYRNMSHNVNVNSLGLVIDYFLQKATERAEEAQTKATAATLDVQDLEEDASPEELMLSYVSGEKSKDRTDRELVTPWFRFLWESFRSMLEILRTNPKLEHLYASVANKAFTFCLQYKRTTEFKRLCDILRQHLTNLINKFRENRDNAPEALSFHLDSRYEQLRTACELELWGEAFRSVEDIQQLLALTKRAPKPPQQLAYFTKLTQIFQQSDAPLYHAWSWHKLFSYSRAHQRGVSAQDWQAMATAVLLAALSVLPYDRAPLVSAHRSGMQGDSAALEQEKERANRMATILGYTMDAKKDAKALLTRQALLGALHNSNLLALVPAEVRAVYDILTQEYNPLEMCTKLAPLLERLPSLTPPPPAAGATATATARPPVDLSKYVSSLRTAAVLRLLRQLSDCYSVMRITDLAALVPFCDFKGIESVVVDAVKHDYLQVRIDHRNGTLHFGSQALESDRVKGHLALVARRMAKAVSMLGEKQAQEDVAQRQAVVQAARSVLKEEHTKAVARKAMIERRKEEAERAIMEAEALEQAKKQAAAAAAKEAEERKRKDESNRREYERLEAEREDQEQTHLRQQLTAKGVKVKDGEKIDKVSAQAELYADMRKKHEESQRKLERTAKQMDHLERAKREEEGPLLEAAWVARQASMREAWEAREKQAAELHEAAWKADSEMKLLLAPMVADKDILKTQIMQRREAEFISIRKEKERQMKVLRERRKVERELARRKEYTVRCQAQVRERIKELEEKKKRDEAERKKAEEAEQRRKLQEIMEKQRAKEEEIDRRKAEERAALLGSAAPAAASAASATAAGGKFVPPMRRAEGDAPPAAAAASGGGAEDGDKWRPRGAADRPAVVPPAAAPPAAAPPSGDDGWRRPSASGPSRDAPSSGGGASWGRSERSDAPPPARDSAPPASGGGGRFVPSALRGGGRPGDAPPPAASGPSASGPSASAPSGSAPPPSGGGGGGAYRPPGRR